TPGEGSQQASVGTLARRGVAIHACDAHAGVHLPEFLFNPLGTDAEGPEVRPGAIRTLIRQGTRLATVVTVKTRRILVQREAHTAIGAARYETAGTAQHKGGKTATVEQYDGLLAPGEGIDERSLQC